jgi:heme exporter protein B
MIRFLELVRFEALLEFRLRTAVYSLLVYGGAAVFMAALAYRKPLPADDWIALFWVVNLFVGVQAVSKSFLGMTEGQQLYWYQLADGGRIILAKLTYHAGLMIGFILVLGLIFASLLGFPFEQVWPAIGVAAAGGVGLAASLTLVSALAAAARQRTTLMAVLSFPLLFPMLLGMIRLSQKVAEDLSTGPDWRFVLGLTGLQLGLSWILFPYLWRE